MTRQLTSEGIKKLKPGKARREVRDSTSGLSVMVTPGGSKSFIMRFRRPDGRTAKLTLGGFNPDAPKLEGHHQVGMPLSLEAARRLAADINWQRAMGKDVIADVAASKQRRRIEVDAKALTYPVAVRQFIAEHARKKNRGWREVARVLGLAYSDAVDEPKEIKGSLAARWGDRPVGEITDHDIFAAIKEAREKGIPGLEVRNDEVSDARGRHLGRALGKLFGWLHQHRKVATDPCVGMFVPGPPPKRQRVLSDAEIRAAWRAATKMAYPFGDVVRLLLLTGCRRDEVADLDLSELGEDDRWIIPGERTKNKLPHLVPLSEQARDLIAEARKFAGDAGPLFSTSGVVPISGFSKFKTRLDLLMREELGDAFQPWHIHDIRRSVATRMASIKVSPHVIEAALNHVSGFKSGVAGVYNVHEYEDEKREALTRWAAHLDLLVTGTGHAGASVVSIWGKR